VIVVGERRSRRGSTALKNRTASSNKTTLVMAKERVHDGMTPSQPTNSRPRTRSTSPSADHPNHMKVGRNKDTLFVIVLCCAFTTGLAVAVALCSIWRYRPGLISPEMMPFAIAICPPFLLKGVLEATADSTLAVVMTVGTIIFANGFLYAGLSSLAYFLATVALAKSRRS
jgi:hypothetical protein